MSDFDSIEGAAMSAASKASSLEDLSKAASTLQALAETRQAREADERDRRSFRVSYIQALASLLVPIVSVVALVATVVFQSMQLSSTARVEAQKIEDTEWRDLLDSLKGSSNVVYDDLTVAPRLQSFSKSSTYGIEARAIGGRLMGHLSNPDGFNDLFTYVFQEVQPDNIDSVIDVSRTLIRSERSLEAQCPPPYDCDRAPTDWPAKLRTGPRAATATRISASLLNLYTEGITLSKALSAYLQRLHTVTKLNLSQAGISAASLSSVDFVGPDVDFTGTDFDSVDFTGAQLSISESKYNDVEFRASNWWDSAKISGPFLSYLIAHWNPCYNIDVTLRRPLSRAEYNVHVKRLCEIGNVKCEVIPFGPEQTESTTRAARPVSETTVGTSCQRLL